MIAAESGVEKVAMQKSVERTAFAGWLLKALCVVIATAMVVLYPRTWAGLACPPNDLYIHYNWAHYFHQALSQGVLYPRWNWELFEGLGGPVFVYYAPAYYYGVSLLRWLLGDLWAAMRAVEFITNCATGLLVMFYFRKWGMSFAKSWLAALLVQSAPFFLLNLGYLSGLPWYAANGWMCLLILASADADPRESRLDFRITLSVAGLALTHTLSAFMALACLPLAVLFSARAKGLGWPSVLKHCVWWGGSAALGLCLSAIYLLPAVTTMSLTNAQYWRESIDWRAAFLFPVYNRTSWPVFQFLTGAVLVTGTLVSVVMLGKARLASISHAALFVAACAVIALFWSSELAYPIWVNMPALQTVQFPYRFFQVASISSGCLLVLAAASISWRSHPLLLIAQRAAVALWVLFACALWAKICFRDGRPVREDLASYRLVTSSQKEYLPVNARAGWSEYLIRGGFSGECQRVARNLIKETADARGKSWIIDPGTRATVRLPLFAYPCWRVTINDAPASWTADPDNGLVSCFIETGRQEIKVEWAGWPSEKSGRKLTLLAVSIVVLAFVFRYRRIDTILRCREKA